MSLHRMTLPLCLTASLLVTGCASSPPPKAAAASAGAGAESSAGTVEQAKVLQITDIPLPLDAKVNGDASLVIGTNDRWLGRVVLKTQMSAVEAYNHFFVGMPRSGWSLLSAVQGKVSILTYTSGERVATVQVEGGTMGGGASATIVVSPRQTESGRGR